MNPRERMMAVVLGLLIVVIGGGGLGYFFILSPYFETEASIENLNKEAKAKQQQIALIKKDRPKLERWRLQGLPGEVLTPVKGPANTAQDKGDQYFDLQDRYVTYLRDLLKKHGINSDYPKREKVETKPAAGQQQTGPPPYTTLVFNVDAKAKFPQLVAWLLDFQKTPLLQRVKKMTIKQDQAQGDKKSDLLHVQLNIEALIVHGATKRPKTMLGIDERMVALNTFVQLRRGPGGIALIPWAVGPTGPKAPPALRDKPSPRSDKDYLAMANKNIFTGYVEPVKVAVKETKKPEPKPPTKEKEREPVTPKDVLRFARLTDISGSPDFLEATLWDPLTSRAIRLREEKSYDRFPLLLNGSGGAVVQGQIVQFEGTRGVIFRVQLAAFPPSKSGGGYYPEPHVIYRPTKSDFDKLVEAKKVKADDVDRVFKLHASYWKDLEIDKVVVREKKQFSKEKRPEFVSKLGLVRGKVVETTEKYVVIRLDEKYCAYDDRKKVGDDQEMPPPRPHYGFCRLTGRLSEALRNPVEENLALYLLEELGSAVEDDDEP